jgi:hypothetical protein
MALERDAPQRPLSWRLGFPYNDVQDMSERMALQPPRSESIMKEGPRTVRKIPFSDKIQAVSQS